MPTVLLGAVVIAVLVAGTVLRARRVRPYAGAPFGMVTQHGSARWIAAEGTTFDAASGRGLLVLTSEDLVFQRHQHRWSASIRSIAGAEGSRNAVIGGTPVRGREPLLIVTVGVGGDRAKVAFDVDDAGSWIAAIGTARRGL
jgi:hypothetical protein